MSRFIETLATARIDGTYLKLLNTISKIPLLIIDDFGLQPLDHSIRLALLQILEDRYKKSSVIITSQLQLKTGTSISAILKRIRTNRLSLSETNKLK